MVLDAFFLAVDVNPIRRIDLRIDPALMKIRRLRIPSQGLARQGACRFGVVLKIREERNRRPDVALIMPGKILKGVKGLLVRRPLVAHL